MMNSTEQHIEHLLQLFMQGESTLEQENELSRYFTTASDVPEQWQHYKQMFAYLDKGMPLPNESNEVTAVKRGKTTRPLMWWTLSAAAAAIAVIVFSIGFTHSPKAPVVKQHPVIAEANDTLITQPPHPASTPINKPITSVGKKITIKPTPLMAKHNKAKPAKKQGNLIMPHLDSVEMEHEQGQMELAQQEVLAYRLIAEQEREQMRNEQHSTRAVVHMAKQEIRQRHMSTEPQAIHVVFK